jgi:hypothetical protein
VDRAKAKPTLNFCRVGAKKLVLRYPHTAALIQQDMERGVEHLRM